MTAPMGNEQQRVDVLTDQQVNDMYREAMAQGRMSDASFYANEAAERGMIL